MRGLGKAIVGFSSCLLVLIAAQSGEITTSRSEAPAGNAAAGKKIFEGKGGCLGCHTVEGQGGVLGPELSSMGVMRKPEELRLSILDPDDDVVYPYFTITVITRQGEQFSGIKLNEDDHSIQIRDVKNNPRSFVKSDLRDIQRELRSLMPSYEEKLSAAEVTDLVAYLGSLRKPLPEQAVDDDDD